MNIRDTDIFRSRSFLGESAPHSECQLWYLFNEYGASPRALVDHAREPAEYEAEVARFIAPHTFQRSLSSPDSDQHSDLIVVMDPSPTSRSGCAKTIASRRVFEMLWDKYLVRQPSERINFYYLLQASKSTADVAGWLFELQMHSGLRQRQTIVLHPVGGEVTAACVYFDSSSASETNQVPLHFELPASHDRSLEAGTKLCVGNYYRPRADSFPGVDSLLFINPRDSSDYRHRPPMTLMFRFIHNEDIHHVNLDSLAEIKRSLPKNTCARYVAVTPSNIKPRITIPKPSFPDRDLESLGGCRVDSDLWVLHHSTDEAALHKPNHVCNLVRNRNVYHMYRNRQLWNQVHR